MAAAHTNLGNLLHRQGRLEEAKAALHEGEERRPWEVTVSHFRRTLYYRNPDFNARYFDGLRKAGLPEGTEA